MINFEILVCLNEYCKISRRYLQKSSNFTQIFKVKKIKQELSKMSTNRNSYLWVIGFQSIFIYLLIFTWKKIKQQGVRFIL